MPEKRYFVFNEDGSLRSSDLKGFEEHWEELSLTFVDHRFRVAGEPEPDHVVEEKPC